MRQILHLLVMAAAAANNAHDDSTKVKHPTITKAAAKVKVVRSNMPGSKTDAATKSGASVRSNMPGSKTDAATISGARQQILKKAMKKQHGHGILGTEMSGHGVVSTETLKLSSPAEWEAAAAVPVAPTSAFEMAMLAIAVASLFFIVTALLQTPARFDCLQGEAPDERRAVFGLRCLVVAPAWVHAAVCTFGVFASFIVHDFLQEHIVKSTGGRMPLLMTAFEFLACLAFPAMQLVIEQRDIRAPFRLSNPTAVRPPARASNPVCRPHRPSPALSFLMSFLIPPCSC